ncbi:MAG: hypothetical protein ACOY94_14470 [Bacillota bacterium]
MRVNFSMETGESFSLFESNGSITVDGEGFLLEERDAVFRQAGDARHLWVDLGDLEIVLDSTSMTRTELEAVAIDFIHRFVNESSKCR